MRTIMVIFRCLLLFLLIISGLWIANHLVEYVLYTRGRNLQDVYIGNSTHSEPFHAEPEEWLQINSVEPNCGRSTTCPDQHVAVSINSHTTKFIRICVAGKVVIERGVNNGGRGVNIVVIDERTLQPTKARRFDTYEKESSALEVFLHRYNHSRNIFVLLSHDDASKHLSHEVRRLITQMGSGQVQNVGFRDHWYMIGQFGIKGFTPFEQLLPKHLHNIANLTDSVCVPSKIEGKKVQADPTASNNYKRESFCKQHPYLEYFCAGSVMREPIASCELVGSRALLGSPLLSAAVIVIAPDTLDLLVMTLETLAIQPGLKPSKVTVIFEPEVVPDVPELCQLFGFSHQAVEKENWHYSVAFGVNSVLRSNSSEHIIVLEEALLLSPDYFSTMASLLPLLTDTECVALSAWNPNGYSGVNSRGSVVHRIRHSHVFAYVVTVDTARRRLLGTTNAINRGWVGVADWTSEGWIAVPEVSRVLVRPAYGDMLETEYGRQLFGRLRRTSTTNLEIMGAEELRGDSYQAYLSDVISSAQVLSLRHDDVTSYTNSGITLPTVKKTSDRPSAVVIPFKETSSKWTGMSMLCKCFGLFHDGESKPMGMWNGVLRFSIDGREVILVSDQSPLFSATDALLLP